MRPIQIKGCEHYSVNEEGVVLNTKTGRVLKTDLLKCGYKRVTLWSTEQKAIRIMSHRLVAIHFISNKNNSPMVNHIDGNKINNHKSNLEWCTCSENTIHAFKTGLRRDTKKNITLETAQCIYNDWKSGESRKDLVNKYRVPKYVVDEILYRNKSYKQVK